MFGKGPMDEIRIEKLEVYAYHGVFPKERRKGQTFVVNATLYTDTARAGSKDALYLSTDYGEVCTFIDKWMRENTYQLLEAVVEHLSKEILLKFALISEIDLEVKKPDAPIDLPFGSVSVKVHRGWHKAYLSVGSNLGDRRKYVDGAVHALESHPQMRGIRVSELIETAPYGNVEQGDFLNGAIELETLLSPEELLEALHGMENAAGRERAVHWGPRTLDLDILFYDDLVYEGETLTIPHKDMKNREFVLRPLSTLAPGYRHPVLDKTVAVLLEELERVNVCKEMRSGQNTPAKNF